MNIRYSLFTMLLILTSNNYAMITLNSSLEELYEAGLIENGKTVSLSLDKGYIPVEISGKKLWFEFDTGAPFTWIKPEVLHTIPGYENENGFSDSAPLLEIREMTLSGITIKGAIFQIYKQNSPEFIAGTIGLNILSKFIVHLDTLRNTLDLHYGTNEMVVGYDMRNYSPGLGARISLPGKFNGTDGYWMLDSGDKGDGVTIFFDEQMESPNFRMYSLDGTNSYYGNKLNENTQTLTGISRSISVADQDFKNLRFFVRKFPNEEKMMNVKNTGYNYFGKVGWSFISNSKVIIDFKRRVISILRYKGVNLDELSGGYLTHFGVRLIPYDPRNFSLRKIVMIQPNSFLYEKGLRVGDVIDISSGFDAFYTDLIVPKINLGDYNSYDFREKLVFQYFKGSASYEFNEFYKKPIPEL